MEAFLLDAAGVLLRWLHVVAAIAWIGESFYFVMLDRALKPPRDASPGLFGELWSVHGGGFYHKRKYLPAPPQLPDELHWSKWKSYTTWLSGFALFTLLYLSAPAVYLVDPAVHAWTPGQAVALALAFPVAGWLVYDALCRVVGFRDGLLGGLVALSTIALAYAATHVFAGRAAFLIAGATLGTIMSANVFFVIIPGQKRLVAALARGESPDPLPGQRGKQRSVHNTYFTLPVVFAMLAIHYAAAYAHPHSWAILALFMAAGAAIRQFFVLWHSGGRAWWLLGAGGVILVLAFAWLAPRPATDAPAPVDGTAGTVVPDATSGIETVPDTLAVQAILARHCGACHSAKPTLIASAPLGMLYDTPAQVEMHAQKINQQAVVLKVMPPGNLTQMTDAERAAIGRWYAARTP
jgi:uncharacterized membrane protein